MKKTISKRRHSGARPLRREPGIPFGKEQKKTNGIPDQFAFPRLRARKSKSSGMTKDFDIVIVGGGPVGLAFAAALKKQNLRLCLIEKQPEKILANPAMDGRDIALTHSSMKILRELEILPRIPDVAPIEEARVLNGTSSYALNFDSREAGTEALGYLISNHLIRKAAYEAVKGQHGLDIRTGVEVVGLNPGVAKSSVKLSSGETIEATLVIAADSRFSPCRKMMGIPVSMRDFGRTVVVCRMALERAHDRVAYECFYYGRTLAVLPLTGKMVSVVITLSSDQAAELLAMPERTFSADVTERFGGKHGAMKLIGERHAYPLVATYADRFADKRFALLGDAAVGMHPVTAHGYNFGLYGVRTLAHEIENALSLGLDIGSPSHLDRYNHAHRRATLPLYMGTNAIVELFTNEKRPARMLRDAVLRLGNFAMPFKRVITNQLTQTSIAGSI
jgi:ubiquinone biosynthesis UbiH/UbiF/VisC/COQ6 family hydroxylase